MTHSLQHIARVLGGNVSSGQVLAPGPGHKPHDRSMAVKVGESGKLLVSSFAGDDPMRCLNFVERKLGIVWQPDGVDANGSAKAIERMEKRAIRVDGHANGNAPESRPVDDRQASALRLWQESADPRGTLVETYLASRGIDLPDGVAMTAIRFHPSCPFGPGTRHPCMMAAFRSIETGAVVAIHRTALTAEGRKLDRKMLGPVAGAAIMLAELDAERGCLTVGEGIESALSGLAMGFAPAWAMGSADAVAKLPALNGVDTLTILAEHDASGTSDRTSRECARRWREAEREVFIAKPKAGLGNDANEAWQARQGDDGDVLDVVEFGASPDIDASDNAGNPGIKATPFVLMDPASIPTRKWLYGRHYIRRFVSATVAPGGVGKSSLGLVEVLAMVTGRNLLGVPVASPLRAWIWNGEDPREELERRLAGACLHHGIEAADIGDRLFLDSGRDLPIRLVEMAQGGRVVVAVPTVEGVERAIRENRIDVLSIDPFVSSHGVPENDNMGIDRAVKTWAAIAERTGCAIELVHHVRKGNGGEGGYTVEDARGGSSLIGAVRCARVLNVMSKEEAERAGIEPEQRRLHFRVDDGKANMAPPMERAIWRRLASVDLGNGHGLEPGDNVGVVTAWDMPGALDGVSLDDLRAAQKAVDAGRWRADSQAKTWAGVAIAQALDLDISEPAAKAKVKGALRVWIKTGAFIEVKEPDEHRHEKLFVKVGEWAN